MCATCDGKLLTAAIGDGGDARIVAYQSDVMLMIMMMLPGSKLNVSFDVRHLILQKERKTSGCRIPLCA